MQLVPLHLGVLVARRPSLARLLDYEDEVFAAFMLLVEVRRQSFLHSSYSFIPSSDVYTTTFVVVTSLSLSRVRPVPPPSLRESSHAHVYHSPVVESTTPFPPAVCAFSLMFF
jgi:hypothetical protein